MVSAPSTPKPNVLFSAIGDLRFELTRHGNKITKARSAVWPVTRMVVTNHARVRQAGSALSRTASLDRPDIKEQGEIPRDCDATHQFNADAGEKRFAQGLKHPQVQSH